MRRSFILILLLGFSSSIFAKTDYKLINVMADIEDSTPILVNGVKFDERYFKIICSLDRFPEMAYSSLAAMKRAAKDKFCAENLTYEIVSIYQLNDLSQGSFLFSEYNSECPSRKQPEQLSLSYLVDGNDTLQDVTIACD